VALPTAARPELGPTVSSGLVDATFLPDLGMRALSLRNRDEELLALRVGWMATAQAT
jgi:hypothetical protein